VECSLSCGGGHAMNLVVVRSLVKSRRASHAMRGDHALGTWSTCPGCALAMPCRHGQPQRPPAWAVQLGFGPVYYCGYGLQYGPRE
jgi:hypothetical protein